MDLQDILKQICYKQYVVVLCIWLHEILLKKKYNTMSDLWSVGVIMYEMFCGNVPYESKNLIDLIYKIKKKDIIFPLANYH